MAARKQSILNRKLSLKNNIETFEGEICRFCFSTLRWTKRKCCVNCYTKTGAPTNFEKRKQQLVMKLKAQAKMKGIDFSITKDDIVWPEKCPIMDIELNYYTTGFREHNTASFDRKNPNEGYTKGNVSVISNIANMRKSDLSVTQLEKLLEYVKTPLYQ